jgi:hypothetical protein
VAGPPCTVDAAVVLTAGVDAVSKTSAGDGTPRTLGAKLKAALPKALEAGFAVSALPTAAVESSGCELAVMPASVVFPVVADVVVVVCALSTAAKSRAAAIGLQSAAVEVDVVGVAAWIEAVFGNLANDGTPSTRGTKVKDALPKTWAAGFAVWAVSTAADDSVGGVLSSGLVSTLTFVVMVVVVCAHSAAAAALVVVASSEHAAAVKSAVIDVVLAAASVDAAFVTLSGDGTSWALGVEWPVA